jgi:hypothetical protein
MNKRQLLQHQSIIYCEALLGDAAFKGRPELAGLRERFLAAAAELRTLSHAQYNAHEDRSIESGSRKALRKDVRTRLMRIGRHAEAVLDGLPGIREDVRLPHGNATDSELLEAAARITKNLRPHVRTLHKTGLPKQEFTKLAASLKALKEKSGSPNTAIARRSRATASIPAAIRRARTIAGSLDIAIRAELPAFDVRRWKHAYRVPKKMGRPKKKKGPDRGNGAGGAV